MPDEEDNGPAEGDAEGVGDEVVDVEAAVGKEVLHPLGEQTDGDGHEPDGQAMSEE